MRRKFILPLIVMAFVLVTTANAIESNNIFSDFKPYGFETKDKYAKEGLDNIIEGRAIPFPLTLNMMSQMTRVHRDQSIEKRWKSEGTIPNLFFKKELSLTKIEQLDQYHGGSDEYQAGKLLVGMGDAVYKESSEVTGGTLKTLITKTCFQCHVGIAPGRPGVEDREPKIVAGLGHAHNDFAPSINALKVFGRLSKNLSDDSLKKYLKPFVNDIDETIGVYREFESYAREIFVPGLLDANTRGDNQGPYAVWYLVAKLNDPETTGIAVRNKGNETKLEHILEENVDYFPPVDPMPWFNARFKKRHYYFWDAPGLGHLDFNMNFWVPEGKIDSVTAVKTNPKAHLKKMLKKIYTIATVLHYARNIDVPRYPYDKDDPTEQKKTREPLVKKGRELFHEKEIVNQYQTSKIEKKGSYSPGEKVTCANCHGTYVKNSEDDGDWEVNYSNLGLQMVGTDPRYNEILMGYRKLANKAGMTTGYYKKLFKKYKDDDVLDDDINEIIQKFTALEKEWGVKEGSLLEDIGPHSYPVKEEGYPAPVLAGIWASAPYLHNGSVPTLMDLLSPESARPEIWGRINSDPNAYDWDKVGLKYETISRLPYKVLFALRTLVKDLPSNIKYRRYYNTKNGKEGRSNKGHEYGTDWSLEEKKALIAFLTDLSGEKIHPKEKPPLGRYDGEEYENNKKEYSEKKSVKY